MKDSQNKRIIIETILVNLLILMAILFCNCESKERFYRPNLPEQLCSVGIIDVDDTTSFSFSLRDIMDVRNSFRFITFEKSFQSEYLPEKNDSLRDLSFNISTDNEEIFNYHSTNAIRNLLKFKLPNSLIFNSGTTYFLHAKEKDLPQISAEITVPEPPSGLTLRSVEKEVLQIHHANSCGTRSTSNSVVFEIEFRNNIDTKNFIMLMVTGIGYNPITLIPYSGPMNFSLRETNTPGFFAEMQGLYTYHWICERDSLGFLVSNAHAYFIDGSKIPGDTCKIKFSIQYKDGYAPFEQLGQVQIKLLSIPEKFYFFEKSLYTSKKVQRDPFSEPLSPNGNIKGGNGIFAICRSSNLTLKFSPPY